MELFPSHVYKNRRQMLVESVGEGMILLPGNEHSPINYKDNCYPFRQDSNFLYFFGITRPNLAGLIDTITGEEWIFGDETCADDIIWTGQTKKLSEICQQVGVSQVAQFSRLSNYIQNGSSENRTIHILPPYRAETKISLLNILGSTVKTEGLKVSKPLIEAVIELRSIKTQREIGEIDKAVSVSTEMFAAARKLAQPGISELEIAAQMSAVAASRGCRTSYPIIATMDGQILHSEPRFNKLKAGSLLLIDAGAETPMGYASDITRTYPVLETFTPQQKDIYDIVLQANQSAISQLAPNVSFRDVHIQAAETITEGLISLGIMKGNVRDIVAQGAHALFFPHGLGHSMGLDVHDMESLGEDSVGYGKDNKRSQQFGLAFLRFARKLEPGHVITVEPGCYFIPELIAKWQSERFFPDIINYSRLEAFNDFGGVRIEDNVLITPNGYRCLSNQIPKQMDQL